MAESKGIQYEFDFFTEDIPDRSDSPAVSSEVESPSRGGVSAEKGVGKITETADIDDIDVDQDKIGTYSFMPQTLDAFDLFKAPVPEEYTDIVKRSPNLPSDKARFLSENFALIRRFFSSRSDIDFSSDPDVVRYLVSNDGRDCIFKDYSAVDDRRMLLVNRRGILDSERPSWILDVNDRYLENYGFAVSAVRGSDGLYYYNTLDKHGRHALYRCSLDVLTATVQYYVACAKERRRLDVLPYNEYASKFFKYVKDGIESGKLKPDEYGDYLTPDADDAGVLAAVGPYPSCGFTYKFYPDTMHGRHVTKKTIYGAADSSSYFPAVPVSRHDIKLRNLYGYASVLEDVGVASEYFDWEKRGSFDKNNYNACYNQLHRMFDEITQKTIDMAYEKLDLRNSYQKGEDTSYGDGGTSDAILQSEGVLVKMQNGSDMTDGRAAQIRSACRFVFSVFGDISGVYREAGIKISYADGKRQHARKAVGLFTPFYNSIGVSFGPLYAPQFTLAHETAHFLDSLASRKHHYGTDEIGSPEKSIADTFYNSVDGIEHARDYFKRSTECFARAFEEYAILEFYDRQGEVSPLETDAYSNSFFAGEEKFRANVKPLVRSYIEAFCRSHGIEAPEPCDRRESGRRMIESFDKSHPVSSADELHAVSAIVPPSEMACILESGRESSAPLARQALATLSAITNHCDGSSYDPETGTHRAGLHYFDGGWDYYATEYDPDSGQFFGFCTQDNEWGYSDVKDIIGRSPTVNLDLHYDGSVPVEVAVSYKEPDAFRNIPLEWCRRQPASSPYSALNMLVHCEVNAEFCRIFDGKSFAAAVNRIAGDSGSDPMVVAGALVTAADSRPEIKSRIGAILSDRRFKTPEDIRKFLDEERGASSRRICATRSR